MIGRHPGRGGGGNTPRLPPCPSPARPARPKPAPPFSSPGPHRPPAPPPPLPQPPAAVPRAPQHNGAGAGTDWACPGLAMRLSSGSRPAEVEDGHGDRLVVDLVLD